MNDADLAHDIEDTVRCVANVLADTAGDRARVTFAFHTKVRSTQRWYMSRRYRRSIDNVTAAITLTVRTPATAGVAAALVHHVTTKDMKTIPALLSAAARHVQAGLDREDRYQVAASDTE